MITSFQSAVSDTEALLTKFRTAARHGAPAFNPAAIPARSRFFARQVKLLRNLLRWRKHTGERYGVGELATRLVEKCVLEVAESGWDIGGESMARTVCRILS